MSLASMVLAKEIPSFCYAASSTRHEDSKQKADVNLSELENMNKNQQRKTLTFCQFLRGRMNKHDIPGLSLLKTFTRNRAKCDKASTSALSMPSDFDFEAVEAPLEASKINSKGSAKVLLKIQYPKF
jgi:hypothetical protein